jgi:predicted aspartyl protease
MAKVYPINLIRADDVILIDVLFQHHDALLVLDTGATNTIIDLNSLLIAGYEFNIENSSKKKFETANGVIEATSIMIDVLTVFDKQFYNIEIYTLDFIDAGIISGYEGVLGLDILKNFNIQLNFLNKEMIVH